MMLCTLLACFTIGAGDTVQPACSPEGSWLADLVIHDGVMSVGPEVDGVWAVTMTGKAVHAGKLTRVREGLELVMEGGPTSTCHFSDGCARLTCTSPDGRETRFRRREKP